MTMGAAEKWGHGKLAGQVINKQTVPLEMNSCQRPRNAGDFQNGALCHSPGPLTYHGALLSLDHECPIPLGGALCHMYISVVSVNKVVNKAPIPHLDGAVTKLPLYSDGQRVSAVSYVLLWGYRPATLLSLVYHRGQGALSSNQPPRPYRAGRSYTA